MEISTKLFNKQAISRFGEINEDIQSLQAQIATGKSILRASDDPVAAVNLSVAKEQRNLLERFETNAHDAKRRLALTDGALQQAINVMTRISELAIQAANDTYGTKITDDDRDYKIFDGMMLPIFCAAMMSLFEGNQ